MLRLSWLDDERLWWSEVREERREMVAVWPTRGLTHPLSSCNKGVCLTGKLYWQFLQLTVCLIAISQLHEHQLDTVNLLKITEYSIEKYEKRSIIPEAVNNKRAN